ncbi:hypothetical protein BBAD15_g9833 [Beauveria bassiana D1-5]|uniref:Uncharacterized protein n=1 Tax=Beauveria bassiana D1-5 TaxID=1245745 RepID=A0A0A2VEY9_BEABA|nr:hypothetical protein BBAD15_g9833 [Beauveria bassiana D1-5]
MTRFHHVASAELGAIEIFPVPCRGLCLTSRLRMVPGPQNLQHETRQTDPHLQGPGDAWMLLAILALIVRGFGPRCLSQRRHGLSVVISALTRALEIRWRCAPHRHTSLCATASALPLIKSTLNARLPDLRHWKNGSHPFSWTTGYRQVYRKLALLGAPQPLARGTS